MKIQKRIISLLLVIGMFLTLLTGCGGSGQTAENEADTFLGNGRSVLRRFIGRMFAHVTRLVIVGGVANEAHLVDLLQHFPQLKELTLFGITFQMTAHQR